jgi:hypothetical protein
MVFTRLSGKWPVIAVAVCGAFAITLGSTRAAQAKFSTQPWQKAVDPKLPNWSREELLKQFLEEYKLEGMERRKVLSLLGEPATSNQQNPNGRFRVTIDTYCLTAKGENSFRLDYDEQDKVRSYFVDAIPCNRCDLFIGTTKAGTQVLERVALQHGLLDKHKAENINQMKIAQIETMIGKLHKSWTAEARVGGRMWVHSYFAWRLSTDGRQIFFVHRYVPKTEWKPGDDSGVSTHGIVSMSADCSLRTATKSQPKKRPFSDRSR